MPIRHAQFEDLSQIVDIYNQTIPSRLVTADLEPITVESRHDWFHTHTPDARPLWVMTGDKDNQITGWLSYKSFYGRPAYDQTVEFGVYIHQNHHRRGIASRLIDHAIAESPNLNVRTLLGFVFGHNAPSLMLLKKYGFEQWAHLPEIATLDGVRRDLIILGKHLDT